MSVPRSFGGAADIPTASNLTVGANAGIIPSTGVVNAHVSASAAIVGSKLAAKARRHTACSAVINVDNGAGAKAQYVILNPTTAITIIAARVIPTITFGTVNAATVQLGTTHDGTDVGTEIVAAVGLTNSLAIGGTPQALTIVSGAVAANKSVMIQHTGIAATVAGEYIVEIEYTVDD